MAQPMLDTVMKKGEEIFQNVSGQLLEKPAVAKAFEAAMVGKSKAEEGFATALKKMNVQSRSEFRGLRARVDRLEGQVLEMREALEALKAKPAARAPKPRATAKKK